jgi:hypothetical protein
MHEGGRIKRKKGRTKERNRNTSTREEREGEGIESKVRRMKKREDERIAVRNI